MRTLKRRPGSKSWAAAALIAATLAVPAAAQDKNLVIGTRFEPTPDPHVLNSTSTTSYYRNYFAALWDRDNRGAATVPGLAESYKVEGNKWIFKLRSGLKFSDGTPITADDVVASYVRARDMPNAPSGFLSKFAGVTNLAAPDKQTVTMDSATSPVALLDAMAIISVIPEKIAKTAQRSDFTGPAANVSSGPYKFASFAPGESVVLTANPNYYGKPAIWDKVTFRVIGDGAARTAALLAGDVDVIDGVSPQDVARIKAAGKFNISNAPSDRAIFLVPDVEHDVSPFIRDADGKEMKVNPLKDVRVRRALAMAIDRAAIRDRVMDGFSFPSGQLLPQGFGGFSTKIAVPEFNVQKATDLLKEAGYPRGFSMTLHCTNDRYVNDARICPVLAQMFTRIGVKTEVAVMPSSVLFPIVTKHDGPRVSMVMFSWGSGGGESTVLPSMFHTYDGKFGTWNLGHYSNKKLDAVIEKFFDEADAEKRHAGMREAMEILMEDMGAIPIHEQSVIYASKANITVDINALELTLAQNIRRAQ